MHKVPRAVLFQPLQGGDECSEDRTQTAALAPNVGKPFSPQEIVHGMKAGNPIALIGGLVAQHVQALTT